MSENWEVSVDCRKKISSEDICFLPTGCNFSLDIQYQPQLRCSLQHFVLHKHEFQPVLPTIPFCNIEYRNTRLSQHSLYLCSIHTIDSNVWLFIFKTLPLTDQWSFRFKSIVGIGVGAGAYILAKFAVSHILILLIYCRLSLELSAINQKFWAVVYICFYDLCSQLIFPDLVEGLVLLNIDPNGKGWIDWAATKVPVCYCMLVFWVGSHSKSRPTFCFLAVTMSLSFPQLSGLTSALPDTVLPHLFSQVSSWYRYEVGH